MSDKTAATAPHAPAADTTGTTGASAADTTGPSTADTTGATGATGAGAADAESPCLIEKLSVAYRDDLVLDRVDLALKPGTVTGIVGPNGAGKSTLIKAALGLVPTLGGSARFFGKPLAQVRHRVGYMPQAAGVDWDYPATVEAVVTMGTYGRLGWFRRPGAAERAKAAAALAEVGMSDLARRQIGELSGGQKQRTFLARALAQQPDLYLMDEPLAGVDTSSGIAILDVLRSLRESGSTVVIVHHDLALVRDFCDRAVLLSAGKVVADGDTQESLSAEHIETAYETPHSAARLLATGTQ